MASDSVETLRERSPANLARMSWHAFRMLLISYKYRFCALVVGWIDEEGWLEYRISRLYGRALITYMAHEVELEGLASVAGLQGNYAVAANHSSYLDWLLLLAHFPSNLRFIAKKEIARIPALGSFAARRAILIDREGGRATLAKIEEAIIDGDNTPILIFPEGTRSKDGQPRKFKRGGLSLFYKYDWPVVPVAIRGAYEHLPCDAVMFKPNGKLTMTVGPPLYPEDYRTCDAFVEAVEMKIVGALQSVVS